MVSHDLKTSSVFSIDQELTGSIPVSTPLALIPFIRILIELLDNDEIWGTTDDHRIFMELSGWWEAQIVG